MLPLVLYRGSRRWRAPQELPDLVGPRPAELEKYCPQSQYLLLDEGAYTPSQLAPLLLRKNVVAAIFQLEHSRTEREFVDTVKLVTHWLSSPRHARLKKDLTAWVKNVLVAKHLLTPEGIQEIKSLFKIFLEEEREKPTRPFEEKYSTAVHSFSKVGDTCLTRRRNVQPPSVLA